MRITKEQLIEMGACKNRLGRIVASAGNTDGPVDVASLLEFERSTYGDLLWLAGKLLPKEKVVRFARDCALLSAKKIRRHCSSEEHELILAVLNGDDAACADAAYADAAYAAAHAAAYAARGVARDADAAYAAAYAAGAGVADTDAACATYATYAAAYAAGAGVRARKAIHGLLVALFEQATR